MKSGMFTDRLLLMSLPSPISLFLIFLLLLLLSLKSPLLRAEIRNNSISFYDHFACKNNDPSLTLKFDPLKNEFYLRGKSNFKSGIPAQNNDGTINVVIEIPAGCKDKWEVNQSGVLFWDKKNGKHRLVNYIPFVGNYGMIPRTLMSVETGGDGDPLDVIVLGPSIPRGSVVKARIIGSIRLKDSGEQDDKMIAVLTQPSPANSFANISSMTELERNGVIGIIETWFENYKGKGIIQVEGRLNAQDSKRILKKCIAAYK